MDVNYYALMNTIHNLLINKLIHRGLVLGINDFNPLLEDFFDIVLANPPYLPGTPQDIYDYALLAGPYGYEAVLDFIDNAYRLLHVDGILLIVFSSLSGEEKVFEFLTRKCFRIRKVIRKHFFFEDIIGVEAVKTC